MGSQFTTVNRGQQYTATITSYDRADEVTFSVASRAMLIVGQLHFTDTEVGTALDGQFDMQPKGFMKFLLPLMAPAVRKDFPRQLASFKSFCESRPHA